ncbi:MAG: hypothetical protein KAK04_08580 [Cyclobacteriaceae bacterium]|nr:hypothetical protein [Cyclobacteriaceae bacterium]
MKHKTSIVKSQISNVRHQTKAKGQYLSTEGGANSLSTTGNRELETH